MKSKSIGRFNSFCRSLGNLERSKTKNPNDDMVLEATVQRFNLSFDLSWKIMKDILTEYMGILDFATGSPRETLQTAYANKLIDSDIWLEMLKTRNKLAYDYDGVLAIEEFEKLVGIFYEAFVKFQKHVEKYYTEKTEPADTFSKLSKI